jgi:hypothetical protein
MKSRKTVVNGRQLSDHSHPSRQPSRKLFQRTKLSSPATVVDDAVVVVVALTAYHPA